MTAILPSNLSNIIQESGVNAVVTYNEISGNEQENDIREFVLSSIIAIRLHEHISRLTGEPCWVRVEESYEKFVGSKNAGLSKIDRNVEYGGQLADIAIHLPHSHRHIFIEVKVFDERRRAASIVVDRAKLSRLCEPPYSAECYLAIFVTETDNNNGSLKERINELNTALGFPLSKSTIKEAKLGGWHWCFAVQLIVG